MTNTKTHRWEYIFQMDYHRGALQRRVSQLIREWEHVSSIRFLSWRRRKPKEDKAECTVGLLAGELIEIPGSRVEEEKKESERKKEKKGKERRKFRCGKKLCPQLLAI